MGDDWKYYRVRFALKWSRGAELCSADLVQDLHARTSGHAIARATDRLREWFKGDIAEADSTLLELAHE